MEKKIFRIVTAGLLVLVLTGTSLMETVPASLGAATSIRVVVDGTVKTGKAKKKSGDWYMKVSDIKKLTGIKVKGKSSSYVSLASVAKKADVGYEYDPVFGGAYFWLDEKFGEEDYGRAYDLGLVKASVHKKRTKAITGTQYRNMLIGMIKKVNKSKVSCFKKNVKTYKKKLLLGEAVGMAYYAAKCIGANTWNYEGFDYSEDIKKYKGKDDEFWDEKPFRFKKIFPYFFKGKEKIEDYTWDSARQASYMWIVNHASDYSGEPMIQLDSKKHSFHFNKKVTYMQAVMMLTRLYDSSKLSSGDSRASLGSGSAVTPDSKILTSKIMKKAKKKKSLTINNLPPTSGFVFGYSYEDFELYARPRDIKTISQLGFNSCRILVPYQTFFDQNVTTVNLTKLKELDELIAAAIRYHVHLNFAFISLPGRWTYTNHDTYKSTASLDMFTDAALLQKAQKVWEIIVKRYKDVPTAYLSFLPVWEAMNKSLSSNLPYTDYTWQDMERSLMALVDTIRSVSPDRGITYEPSATNTIEWMKEEGADQVAKHMEERYSNILFSSNFCEMPYVYQEMTASTTEHIDHANHGMFKQDYPLAYPYAYPFIHPERPVIIDGFLPKGTKLNIYLEKAQEGSTFTISADDEILAEKSYSSDQSFTKISGPLSRYVMYSDSEEKISVTLEQEMKELKLTATGQIDWCGIEVVYPDAYALNKLYFPSGYDAAFYGETHTEPYMRKTSTILLSPTFDGDQGDTHLTLHKDLSCTSEKIAYQSDSGTIAAFFKEYHELFPKALIRYECADCNDGTTITSKVRYYSDLLSRAKSYGYSWLSAMDFDHSFKQASYYGNKYLGGDYMEYRGYRIERKVIKTLQKYQHSKRW